MKHPSIGRHSGVNFYHGFGGAKPSSLTRTQYGVQPKSLHYTMDGFGRDTYIGFDQGGLMRSYEAARAPHRGLFEEKRRVDLNEKSLARIPSKHVKYLQNGSGRDGYI